MNTQTHPTKPATTPVVTYDIRINEQQRRVVRTALRAYIRSTALTPNNVERDEFGASVAGSLEDMLSPDGSTGQLAPTGTINSFVL